MTITSDLVRRLKVNTNPELDVLSPKNEALRLEAADAITQQEAEIARLQKAFEQERANNLRNAREATEWCDAAEKAEAERDEWKRKLDDAVKALSNIQGEPVAWMHKHPDHITEIDTSRLTFADKDAGWEETPLYAAPSAVEEAVKAEPSKPQARAPRDDWHYDSQGYCDNPGRGY